MDFISVIKKISYCRASIFKKEENHPKVSKIVKRIVGRSTWE